MHGAAGPLIAGDCQSTPRRPAAARLPLYSTGRRRVASPVRGCHCCTAARRPAGSFSSSLLCPGPRPGRARASRPLLHDSTVPGPAAGPNPAQPAFPPRSHCARARRQSDLGPVGLSSSLSLCPGPRPGRTRLGPYTTPAGGRAPAGRHLRRAATPADGRTQFGRCGVLTRILAGAAAAAGPGRPHPPVELAGPDLTTRHGDEATASSSCRLPVPLFQLVQGPARCAE